MRTQKNHSRKKEVKVRYSAPEEITRFDQLDLIINQCRCAYCSDKLEVFAHVESNIGIEMFGGCCNRCDADFWLNVDEGEIVSVEVRRKLGA